LELLSGLQSAWMSAMLWELLTDWLLGPRTVLPLGPLSGQRLDLQSEQQSEPQLVQLRVLQ
jgi:hypothetical protein